ncbi:hypothetical protein BREVNS_1561 [Brevinematales bacterium NS]|nr:hypothetical protein BREVNS_1561 [Brevinematales bacterium NS]
MSAPFCLFPLYCKGRNEKNTELPSLGGERLFFKKGEGYYPVSATKREAETKK